MQGKSQTACRLVMTDVVRATASSVFLGKSSAEEKRAQRTWPLSLRNPTISTWIWFSCGGCACARAEEESNRNAPARTNISRRLSLTLIGHLLRYGRKTQPEAAPSGFHPVRAKRDMLTE